MATTFKGAQNVYIPRSIVQNSSEADISSITLFFSAKPTSTNNASGIYKPGVTIYLVDTVGPSIPDLSSLVNTRSTRVEWDDILTSNDASSGTVFRFDRPLPVSTDAMYSVIIKYDGDEAFSLYAASGGQLLYGSGADVGNISSDSNMGNYFSYITPTQNGNTTQNSSSLLNVGTTTSNGVANIAYLEQFWNPSTSSVLKMKITVARYAVNGDFDLESYSNTVFNVNAAMTVSGSNTIVDIPQRRYEYFSFDAYNSDVTGIGKGELVFQKGVFWPNNKEPATISVSNSSLLVTAVSNTINWNTYFPSGNTTPSYFVIYSKDHFASGVDAYFVTRFNSIVSNTVLKLDTSVPFTNTNAYFFKAPVATADSFLVARINGLSTNVLIAIDSSSNSSMRFVNSSILSVNVSAGGTGYSNSDYLTFTGFGNTVGGYSATANVTTNTTGGITTVYMSNLGCGFTNSSNIVVAASNSSNQPSSGSGATFSYTTGSTILSEMFGVDGSTQGGHLSNVQILSFDISDEIPNISVGNPTGTAYQMTQRLPYYRGDDGIVYCDADGDWDSYDIKNGILRRANSNSKRRVLPSWSQELVTPYANGTNSSGLGGSTNGASLGTTSNASVISVIATSNNDFSATKVSLGTSSVQWNHYYLNNDYTGENTNYGNAWAKGIEKKFLLANNSFAEDLFVYSTVYRPPGANIIAFARLYNSADSDAFDDKDWTMLNLISGANTYSSPINLNDTFEMTWTIPDFPNTAITFAGSATTTNNSTTITGVGSNYQSNGLSNNDLVKIYSPLFPQNYMIAVVNSVANDTSFTITKPVVNNGIIGTMSVDKLAYPHQVFKNDLNSDIAQYYNLNMVQFDTFNVIQIKLVMTSSNTITVPEVIDCRVGATSV